MGDISTNIGANAVAVMAGSFLSGKNPVLSLAASSSLTIRRWHDEHFDQRCTYDDGHNQGLAAAS
jgi:hypothetical protein